MIALSVATFALASAAQAQQARPSPSRGQMGFATPVGAQSFGDPGPGRLRDFLFGGRTAERAMPPVARFRADNGDGFVLQRFGANALLKFEDSSEVWALNGVGGPRGDTIFKNDVGDPVLRMTRLGGFTLFTGEQPDGLAVSMNGAAGPLKTPGPIGPSALFQALAGSSARASRAAQHLISFVVVPDATPKTDWLFADAAILCSEAFVRLAQQGAEGRNLAARFGRVEFLTGGSVQAMASSGVVRITVAPGKGVAGRPSSQRIYLMLSRR